MKFLVDAHLPPRLWCGIESTRAAVHPLQLPDQNATKDCIINQVSLSEERIVISKDSDFFYSHLLQGRPWKLLLVKTGNISMRDLCELFERNLPTIEAALECHTLVEIDRATVTPVL